MKSSSMWPTYPKLRRIQRWTEEKNTNDHDWLASSFFVNYYEGYISHTKPKPSDPNDYMLEGGEDPNIS
jgi:hypothetical protein